MDLNTLPYSSLSFRMILSDLAKYSVTRSIARTLCDTSASCFLFTVCSNCNHVYRSWDIQRHLIIAYPWNLSCHLKSIKMAQLDRPYMISCIQSIVVNIILPSRIIFKVIESSIIWKLGYGFLFAFHSKYGRIFDHFGDSQRQRMAWPIIWVWGCSRSLNMARFDRPCMTSY